MRHRDWTILTAALLCVATSREARGQSGAQDSTVVSTLTGVYTEQQASRGQRTYRAKCTSCHAETAYSGEAFTRSWATRTAYDLFELIRTTMPNDDPGSLSRAEYAEIVAYLFQLNGFPRGKQPLPSDREGLKRVKIEPTRSQ